MKISEEFDPSLHIIPLDKNKTPVFFGGEEPTLPAVTDNGRISFFPMEKQDVLIGAKHKGYLLPVLSSIKERIELKFPKDRDIYGNKVKQYLVAAVMYGDSNKVAFIFEVHGFTERFKELDVLYDKLKSLAGCTVGDEKWISVQNYLSQDPIKTWINELIKFLKQNLNWTNYVRQSIDSFVS